MSFNIGDSVFANVRVEGELVPFPGVVRFVQAGGTYLIEHQYAPGDRFYGEKLFACDEEDMVLS